LKGFSKLFICHRTNNLFKCEQFIYGLFDDCKSNIERITERIPDINYDQLHHFISESPWESFPVMDAVATKVYTTLSVSNSTKSLEETSIGCILDESGWEKAGKKSVGVSRQYIGQVGKIANGQVGVFASLCNNDQVGLVQGRLYLPQTWVDDKDRCHKGGIPNLP
jgi:SRSO17 transposase